MRELPLGRIPTIWKSGWPLLHQVAAALFQTQGLRQPHHRRRIQSLYRMAGKFRRLERRTEIKNPKTMKWIYKLQLLQKKREIRAIQKKQLENKKRQYKRYILASLAEGKMVKCTMDDPDPILEDVLKEMGVKYEDSRTMRSVTYYIPVEQ